MAALTREVQKTALSPTARTGSLTFLYQNNRPVSKADISFQRSTDGGQHWSNARFLSVNRSGKPARNDQFFPWVAGTGDGHLYAIWLDRRLDPANVRINTWEARSANGGARRNRHLHRRRTPVTSTSGSGLGPNPGPARPGRRLPQRSRGCRYALIETAGTRQSPAA